MSETVNHTVDITDQCVRQLIFYLHATSLLDGIRPDDLAKTHETLKLLAKEAGIDLKDPDNGKVREHVKDATKLIMERTGLIEKQEDGTYRIPNEQLYKDTIYTIGLRLDRERALHAMLDVSTKVQEKALKAALGIFKSDRDIAESVSETLREQDDIMRLAEAVVQNAKESRLSRAADFLADENVRSFAEEICRYTKEAASQATTVHSTAKKVLETAKKVSDETYLAATQVLAHPELYGDTVEETAKEVDSVWSRNESAMARLVDGVRSLARLDHDIPLLSGFLDVHKELFPEMPKLRYEDISNEAKEKIGDRRNCWQICLVNGATSVFSSIVTVTRGKLVKALEKHRPEASRREKESQFLKRVYQNAVVNLLTKGDAWLRTRYEASLNGVCKMDDICMQVYDLRLKNLERERDPKENGLDFAKAFSGSNLWRCGISKNIPGWFRYMQTGPEDRAWTLASLKAGIRVSEEGVKWDSALAKAGAEKIYRTYMHGAPGYPRWEKDMARLEESLVHEHEAAKEQMEHLREIHGRTKLSEYASLNLADEKLSVNGKVYTIRTYQIAYTSLRDALGDYLESDNSNLFVDANGTNYNGDTFEDAYRDKIVNKHGRAAFEIIRKGIEIDFTDKFQAILDANGIKLNDSIQRTKDTDTIEYAGETYYVDKYSYTRLSSKDDIKDTLPEVYKDAPVIDFTNVDDTAKAIYEYTKEVFLQARASQASGETVSAYYIVNLSDDVEDDTDDLMAKLKKLLRADTEFYDSEYVITYPSMRNKTVYDGGALYACEATQTCNKQTAAQNLYVEDSADIVEDKKTIGVAAKIPSNENILDEDAEKEKVKEKAEEKNVGVLKSQDPDNDIVENAEEENTEEENATGVDSKEDTEPEANEEVTGAKAEAFDVTEDK